MKRKKALATLLIMILVLSMIGNTSSEAAGKKKKPKLSSSKITLEVGSKKTIKLKNASKASWSVKNKKVVKITKKSKKQVIIKALKKGTTYVYGKVNGKKLKCKVKVAQNTVKDNGNTENSTSQDYVVPTTESTEKQDTSAEYIKPTTEEDNSSSNEKSTTEETTEGSTSITEKNTTEEGNSSSNEKSTTEETTEGSTSTTEKNTTEDSVHEHNWVHFVYGGLPTCTLQGGEILKCSICEAMYTKVLPSLGHDYKNGICQREGCEEVKISVGNATVRLVDSQNTGYQISLTKPHFFF